MASPIGKTVAQHTYVHSAAWEALSPAWREVLAQAAALAGLEATSPP